jgi:hypothetical protein
MSKRSGDVRTICGLAAASAIIAACPARAADDTPYCMGIPYLPNNPVLTFGHVTSAANRVHFVKNAAAASPDCPSRAPACVRPDYVVPGDRVIISDHRHDTFTCVTYINARGGARSSWLPADTVADDKAEPVAVTDWLGHWHYKDIEDGWPRENDISVKAGNAGTLRIEGAAKDRSKGETSTAPTTIKSDVTPDGDRLSFTSGACKVWMQRLGPWLIVKDEVEDGCGRGRTTFGAVYTRQP